MELTEDKQRAIKILAGYFGEQLRARKPPTITEFAHTSFYIPETSQPIRLLPHQISILEYALDPNRNFTNIIYSTVKKSGKTAIASLVARWVAETWGNANEVLCLANDMEQARGRIYAKALDSIQLDPNFNISKKELPGKWKIIERNATFLPNRSILRAVSSDYKGEAGSNPTMTLWSELWAYSQESSLRLWDELTPVPTRERSIRYIETYAGYEGESQLLFDQYSLGLQGRQLTHDDIYWPFPDQPPIWVNDKSRTFMYWDSGTVARRMPWQTQEYYAAQEATLRPLAFRRLHLNEWTSAISAFIPIEWWDANKVTLPPLDYNTPIVIGADAATTSDCCALAGMSRNPTKHDEPALRLSRVWYPPVNGTINLTNTIEAELRDLCKRHNIVEIAYDNYQLHKLMSDLTTDSVAWCRPFSQMAAREVADKQLYDLIRDRRLAHDGTHSEVRVHLANAAGKSAVNEDTKLRIIKKTQQSKIDLAVAMSMGTDECLRLML